MGSMRAGGKESLRVGEGGGEVWYGPGCMSLDR